jgi:hypothetical protein
MKFLKILVFIVVILVAIVLIGALIAPKEFGGSSEIVIQKPKQEVYDYIKLLDNQENYGTWHQMDPKMKTFKEGTDGTVGYVYRWESEKFMVGNGKQVITHLEDGKRMESDLFFEDSEDPAKSVISVEDQGPHQTMVKWKVVGKSPYPWNFMNLFFNMDKSFQEGLSNLKSQLEK